MFSAFSFLGEIFQGIDQNTDSMMNRKTMEENASNMSLVKPNLK